MEQLHFFLSFFFPRFFKGGENLRGNKEVFDDMGELKGRSIKFMKLILLTIVSYVTTALETPKFYGLK